MDDLLAELAVLLRKRDDFDARIAQLTGRSARSSDVGEFIASRVFDIELADTATQAGYDGRFRSGSLAGRTVNIKLYGNALDGLDIALHPSDFYLVLSGSRPATGSVGHHRWHIAQVFLFQADRLRIKLDERGVKIGTATSLRKSDLAAAEIYPTSFNDSPLHLTAQQQQQLALFT